MPAAGAVVSIRCVSVCVGGGLGVRATTSLLTCTFFRLNATQFNPAQLSRLIEEIPRRILEVVTFFDEQPTSGGDSTLSLLIRQHQSVHTSEDHCDTFRVCLDNMCDQQSILAPLADALRDQSTATLVVERPTGPGCDAMELLEAQLARIRNDREYKRLRCMPIYFDSGPEEDPEEDPEFSS